MLPQKSEGFGFGERVQALDSLLPQDGTHWHEVAFVNEFLVQVGSLLLPRKNVAVLDAANLAESLLEFTSFLRHVNESVYHVFGFPRIGSLVPLVIESLLSSYLSANE